jgi:hypothetical protein
LKDPVIFLQFAALSRCQRTCDDLLSSYPGNGLSEAGFFSTLFGLPCQAFIFTFFRLPTLQRLSLLRFSNGLVKRFVVLLGAGGLVKSLFSLFFRGFPRFSGLSALRFPDGLVKRLVVLLGAGGLVKSLFSLFFPAFRAAFRESAKDGLSFFRRFVTTSCVATRVGV